MYRENLSGEKKPAKEDTQNGKNARVGFGKEVRLFRLFALRMCLFLCLLVSLEMAPYFSARSFVSGSL